MEQDKTVLPQYLEMTFEVTVTGAMRDEHVELIEGSLLRHSLAGLPCVMAKVEYTGAVSPEVDTPGWDTGDEEESKCKPDSS